MGKSQKLELLLEREQAKDFFRDLATYLEEGKPLDDYGIDLSGHKKIKISLVEEDDHLALKIKVKDFGNHEERESREEQYGSLKKRMKAYFKAIGQAASAGEIPSDELISTFMADSRSMVSYPGKGDEFYPAYLDGCDALQQAFDQQDPAALHDACRTLARCMAECHARYK